jgi:biofilm PGA synthesis N-glycosyltransferase PgaC
VHLVAEILLGFVAIYPVATAAAWVSGGLLFRLADENNEGEAPPEGWPPVAVLIPAYNEEEVIGTCVRAALAVDYPHFRVLVLDDGSDDETADRAVAAGGGDPRLEVVKDPVNVGKGERLNKGFHSVEDPLVVVTDADTHVHPLALKLLVARMGRSSKIGAVAGAPHVTNRRNLLEAMQILEAASIIGLIRRTQATAGRVGTVAGVLGLFRREAVLAVGGYDGRIATEDIDLSWRLLMAGWHTSYEPKALVGMEVPSTLHALWLQRRRWSRGQGEVLHRHLREVARWRNRFLWPLAVEALASLLWVTLLALSLVAATAALAGEEKLGIFQFGLAWGIAISVVAMIQLAFALEIEHPYDRLSALAFLLGPIYPLAYWTISALAALRSEIPALIRGPRERDVAWNVPRGEG